ncbi:hypothetical protein [Flavobacterium tructae]|uniref:hypothetical protein n=1 Tax=Flavobacterium tructae TaxID=1114873 RepID=UPI0035A8890E
MNLTHDFYIIESLESKDINDGRIFYEALLSIEGFNPKYVKLHDFKDLKKALLDYDKSNYKYLFVSSHGDEENLKLNNETVNSYDLEDINVNFDQRRIFMSTCRGGSYLFAKYFIKNGAYSVIGTPEDLPQIVATGMWPTMLIMFERLNHTILNFDELNKTLKVLVGIYQIPLHYYSFVRNRREMKEYIYNSNKLRVRKNYSL